MAVNDSQEPQKSSSQILDEIFRELEEKTSKGEIAVTDLARLIAQVKEISSGSEEESVKSHDKTKKKHKHKHKKSKKHKKKHKHKKKSDISEEKVVFVQSESIKKDVVNENQLENKDSKQELDTKKDSNALESKGETPKESKSGPEVSKTIEISSEEVEKVSQDASKLINDDSKVSVIEEGEIEDESDDETKGTKRKSKKQKGTVSKVLKSSIVCVTDGDSTKKKKDKKKKKKKKRIKRFTSPLSLHTTRSRRYSSSSYSRSDSSSSRDSSLTGRNSKRSRSPIARRNRRTDSRERKRSRSASPSNVIDKAKLLEIARKNAMAMMAQGRLPPGLPAPPKPEEPVFRRTGKSVAELTDFCKLISKKEFEDDDLESDGTKTNEDGSKTFIHHPFKPRERQPDIVMRIRNAVQIPTKTSAEKVAESSTKLRIQFPVSSGTQHRKKESEWVPVSPDKEQIDKSSSNLAIEAPTAMLALPAPPPPPPPPPPVSIPVQTQPPPPGVSPQDCVFPEQQAAVPQLDIGAIVSQRLQAVRKLMDNPNDVVALSQMYKSQKEMQSWAKSKHLPGQFTGTTDVTLLTPQQLAGPAHSQAWVRKDQFTRATPVQSGFGMHMLQKMGWKPGEGLGKNKEGAAEPLMLDIKMDKKGLVSQDEIIRKNRVPNAPAAVKDLSGKHPVSALGELCSKRRWHPPDYTVVFDGGPEHKKNFVFKVKVNGVEYQPTIASLNKKHAKAQCATVCLQALGLVPRDLSNPL